LECELPQVLIDDERSRASILLDHRFANLRTIPELVGKALAFRIDQHALCEGVGRVQEAPCRGAVHLVDLSTHALPESDANPVVSCRPEGQPG
jgi:hypothetical protein